MSINKLINYYENGFFQYQCSHICRKAMNVLAFYIYKSNINNISIVIDIDDTAINNYHFFKNYGFKNTIDVWNLLTSQTNLGPILPIFDLYKFCLSHGVKVFFISARLNVYEQTTRELLKKSGYSIYENLYLIPKEIMDYRNMDINFKVNVRKEIIRNGYNIIMNAGDQLSDFSGGSSGHIVRLPNYIYGDLVD